MLPYGSRSIRWSGSRRNSPASCLPQIVIDPGSTSTKRFVYVRPARIEMRHRRNVDQYFKYADHSLLEPPSHETLRHDSDQHRRTDASCVRMCCCISPGSSQQPSMESAALEVCNVPSTRCPVSAAASTVEIVSLSLISPMTITSGSCRSAARKPSKKVGVSIPISR